jgi:DNA mismatch repair protein MutS
MTPTNASSFLMTFQSILFEGASDSAIKETSDAPPFFIDLNLDQIVDAITIGKDEYNLKPFYFTPLQDLNTIHYRHGVLQDLESDLLFNQITSFAEQMRVAREYLAQAAKLHHKLQQQSWFLDAVELYCHTTIKLTRDLSTLNLQSNGFSAFRHYLNCYIQADRFTSLLAETNKLKCDLSTVKYCVLINGNGFKVRRYESEIDYSANVEATFEKFRQGAVNSYASKFSSSPDMNSVEEKVLDFVALLYPAIFGNLDSYCTNNRHYLDERISRFDREIQFYLSYLDYIKQFRRAGLKFCFPILSDKDKAVHDYEAFDLGLAFNLIREESPVVCNDFYLEGKERIMIVSGPNQGGKTTFARTFGQLHYLAALGCLVPGREAQLFLCDGLFTHFEKEEDIKNLRGKLEDDLFRIHQVLQQMTSQSIVIMNESFTSTTLSDAILLNKNVLETIIELDSLAVCVTFIDELASLSEKTVSMVSTVVPDNPASRTYKLIRKPADGLSYALSIAEKYRLTYRTLKERIAS